MLTKNKLLVICLFGFISGFTLMISGNTLNYWLARENIDLRTIGVFALISLPYSINFLWAPIFDTKKIGRLSDLLGHRLSWLCIIQFTLAFFVFLLSKINPQNQLLLLALTGLVISFLSSAQDAILGALKTEIISKDSQGAASGIYIFGYRIGMLISNSGAIYLSASTSWGTIYQLFAIIVALFPIVLIFTCSHYKKKLDHPINFKIEEARNKFSGNYILWFINKILKFFGSFKIIIWIIIFLILYRLPDNFINMMINPFLIHLGYNEFEVASVGKFFGVSAAIIGGFIASLVMRKHNILSSLLIFGIMHTFAHSLFIIQETYGKNIPLLFLTIGFESITGGMTMAAYIAFIASLCHGRYRATQYSFYSSMMGFSRSILPAFSGYIVIKWGWQNFFIYASLATLPSLLIIFKLKSLLKGKGGEA